MENTINKLHLGIYAVVQSGSGELLLVEKTRGPYAGKLDLPGGKMEHGENFNESLSRELMEEVGIRCGEFHFFNNMTTIVEFLDDGDNISMHHVGLVYRAIISSTKDISLDISDEDVGGAKWVNVNTVSMASLSPFAKNVVNSLLEK